MYLSQSSSWGVLTTFPQLAEKYRIQNVSDNTPPAENNPTAELPQAEITIPTRDELLYILVTQSLYLDGDVYSAQKVAAAAENGQGSTLKPEINQYLLNKLS